MDELYGKILYRILHFAGCDADLDRAALLEHLKVVFKLEDNKYRRLLEAAKTIEEPTICLSAEVIEAKIPKSTDANGLSDPFCTLYLASNGTQQYNTTIKPETLNPVWEEHFLLPVKNPSQDVLCVELWDFDPDEGIREKMLKVKEIKGVRGLKLFMKEIVVTASTGKQTNELIGSALIPLKNIPASGHAFPCTLDKNGKLKKQADVRLRLSFQFAENTKAFQEHRLLLYHLLLHELEIFQGQSYKWTGQFSNTAETILSQHYIQCGLSPLTTTLARWLAFINVHLLCPIGFTIFLCLLQKLMQPLRENIFTRKEMLLFWDAVTKLLPSCLMGVRRTQLLALSHKTLNQSWDIFRLLSQLAELQPTGSIVLFPFSVYNWLPQNEDEGHCDIKNAVVRTISQGAKEWFSQILEGSNIDDVSNEEERLKCLQILIDTVETSLRKATGCNEVIFHECFEQSYAEILYKEYESKIAELVVPIITNVCKSMKPLTFGDDTVDGVYDNDPLAVGSALLEIYNSLQKFAELGTIVCQHCSYLVLPNNYHNWFYSALIQWIYISKYKTLRGIRLSVQKDNLIPIDSRLEISSSADDALHLFDQIKVSWKRLAWPDAQTSYVLVSRIINDICESLVFYADEMYKKAQELHENDQEFQFMKEWCTTVKNINHVQQSVSTIISQYEVEDIILTAAKLQSSLSEEECRQSVHAMVRNGIESSGFKIQEILRMAPKRMMPYIRTLLMRAVESVNTEDMNELMKYLDDNLYCLHSSLNSQNFSQVFNEIWKTLLHTMSDIVDNNMKMKRQSPYLSKFQDILQKIVEFFKQIDMNVDLSNLADLEQLLKLNKMATSDLIHQCYLELLSEQEAMQEMRYGLLTVKLQFVEEFLRIEILNARNLQALCPSGFCNPYVKICLLPEDKFTSVLQHRTKTQKKTAFPLFDEKFTIQLTKDQRNVENALMMFLVKDEHLLGTDKFLGEALLPFNDVPNFNLTTKFENIKQIHLKLNRSVSSKSDVHNILKHRQDKLARDFIKTREIMFSNSMMFSRFKRSI